MPTWVSSSFYLLIVWNSKCDELRILSTGILSPSGALNINFSWSQLQREIMSPFPFISLWSAIFQGKYGREYKTKQQLCELQKWWGSGEFCPWALCRLVLTVSPDTQSFMLSCTSLVHLLTWNRIFRKQVGNRQLLSLDLDLADSPAQLPLDTAWFRELIKKSAFSKVHLAEGLSGEQL